MANEFKTNIGPTTSQFRGIWELTRAMKKAGFRHKASSDGTTKVVSDDPLADKWGGTITTLNSGSTASITAIENHPYGKLMTVVNLSGLLSPQTSGGRSEGNYLTISGSSTANNNGNWQIYEVISSTSCKVLNTNASPAVDNSGALTWAEKDANSEVYGTGTTITDGSAGWIVLEGPLTQQLSFTSAPTGNFVRGEIVRQDGTSAYGECIGYVWDSSLSSGWMIVMPRVGQFNNSGSLTGSWSAASVTPTALYNFRRQWVFAKSTSITNNRVGGSWYQCVREDTESADLFSTLAGNVNCTASVPPGGSTTSGNRFPATLNSYVLRATNNSTNDGATALSLTDGFYDKTVEGRNSSSSAYCNGRIHIGVASAMPRLSASADGSWYLHHGNTNINDTLTTGSGTLFHFGRMETSDPGEGELYYHFVHTKDTASSRNISFSDQQGSTATYTVATSYPNFYSGGNNGTGNALFGFRALFSRSVGAGTSLGFGNLFTSFLYVPYYGLYSSKINQIQRQRNHPQASTRPLFKEPVTLLNSINFCYNKTKWIFMSSLGNNYDSIESKGYFCISSASLASNITPAIYVGPCDGTTTLIQL
jgi:hypothetical protein